MADTIYTIPVNEAFETDCECPVCELRKRFENETVEYFAGPSLMEPDTRIQTNDIGFCSRHFGMLFSSQTKKLGLGLMLDTYMKEQLARIKKYAGNVKVGSPDLSSDVDGAESAPVKKGLFGKKNAPASGGKGLSGYIRKHERECAVCRKLDYTMDRYVDIIFHMYKNDKDFREKLVNSKGFCLPDTALLIEEAEKKLSSRAAAEFCGTVSALLISNLERIEGEVDWFTKKFDYRNVDADWGNSRDALPRGIQKMTGNTDIID
ncbi:MAG: DUF6062 family protein [Clostridia bacterium]|nr:DUF6062 family protein [Clostridia bacterium]